MTKANKIKLSIIAFGLYFLTGVACVVVGSSLGELASFYNRGIDDVVLLISAYALGRVLTVYFSGKAVDKYGPLKVVFVTTILVIIYVGLITVIDNFYLGLGLAFLGGIGLGGQDATCPLILSQAYKDNYPSALSAGQGLFCIGSFLLSFLVGLTKSFSIPLSYAYFVPAILGLVIVVLVPFTKLEVEEIENSETVKPLYTKNKWLAIVSAYACMFLFCAYTNNECTYISSYVEFLGYDFGSYVLTIYNAGCLVGAFVFVIILKKVSEKLIVFGNCALALVAMVLAEVFNTPIMWFVMYFIVGFFMGVLFSIIVSIITRIGYKHISLFASFVGVVGGAGDIITPIATGALIKNYSLVVSTKIGMTLLLLMCIFSLIILLITKEEN